MRVRRGNDWTFSRRRAFHALGLDGTGVLHPTRIRGVLRVDRGGVWKSVEGANRGGGMRELSFGELGMHR